MNQSFYFNGHPQVIYSILPDYEENGKSYCGGN